MTEENTRKYYEYNYLVTFDDTNSTGNVYFAQYFKWMGKCREHLTYDFYPEFTEDLDAGFGFATESAHIDFFSESFLFNKILIKLYVPHLSRTRIEFEFEFINEESGLLLSKGSQGLVWVKNKPKRRVCLMPDKLYEKTLEYFEPEL
ncbi:MAG: hypothetical protein GY756_19750 [bacterium]|nr:hypothetical protein [bacterium]